MTQGYNSDFTGIQVDKAVDKALDAIKEVTIAGETSEIITVPYGALTGNIDDQTNLKNALDAKQGTLTAGSGINISANNVISVELTESYANQDLSNLSGTGENKVLPSQTGNTGKFLSTNGTYGVWSDISQVPSQTGQSGKYLTTDGTTASWGTINYADKQDVFQYATMPTATQATVGKIYEYIGTTNSSFTNGYFYKGITTPESMTATQTAGLPVGDITTDIEEFKTAMGQGLTTDTYEFIMVGKPTDIKIKQTGSETEITLIRDDAQDDPSIPRIGWADTEEGVSYFTSTENVRVGTQVSDDISLETFNYAVTEITTRDPDTTKVGFWSLTDYEERTVDINSYGIYFEGIALVGATISVDYNAGSYSWSRVNVQPHQDISNLANKDLSNLSSTGQGILDNKLNKNQITNCILEDPQKINLTLSEGTLTLKAGSVVCVPNGFESDGTTPKFDEVTIASDATITNSFLSAWSDVAIVRKSDGTLNQEVMSTKFCSGSSDSLSGSGLHFWYDTTNNIVKQMNGTTQQDTVSFPFCLMNVAGSGGGFTSIDQTFQSIGYIGSTVFVRKGLKVLIPDGRNADGSLKNVEYTTDKVLTNTGSSTDNSVSSLLYANGEVHNHNMNLCTYDDKKNLWYDSHSSSYIIGTRLDGTRTQTSGAISNFKPYTATNILKYSDKSQISGWGMPSTRYTDLTLGASGSTYTAPANGWFCIYGIKETAGYTVLRNTTTRFVCESRTTINITGCGCYIPVIKNDIVECNHDGAYNSNLMFRFYYAEGETN